MPSIDDTSYLGSGLASRIRALRLAEADLSATEIARRVGAQPKYVRRVLTSMAPQLDPSPSSWHGTPPNSINDRCSGCHYWHRLEGRDVGSCESDLAARALGKEAKTPALYGCVYWRAAESQRVPVQELSRHKRAMPPHSTTSELIGECLAWHERWRGSANG